MSVEFFGSFLPMLDSMIVDTRMTIFMCSGMMDYEVAKASVRALLVYGICVISSPFPH